MQRSFVITALGLLVIGYVTAKGNAPKSASWESFKNFHAKIYANDENEAYRRENFEKNAAAVAAHNLAFKQGKVTYTKELNAFSDIDPNVFKWRNGFQAPKAVPKNRRSLTVRSISTRAVPASFDWRDKGKVTPIKNQGGCGSCWAFSAIGALESAVLIKSGGNVSLSEQQLVSCDENDHGCNGGFYTTTWNYIINTAKGVQSANDYPYKSGGGSRGTCAFAANKVVQKMTSSKDLFGTTDAVLMQALVTYGPISVAIDASDMQSLSEQIYSCGTVRIDHAVLLVGYGTSPSGKNYWILKNSWGTGWGEKGYFKMARGAGDCGITQWPAYPIL